MKETAKKEAAKKEAAKKEVTLNSLADTINLEIISVQKSSLRIGKCLTMGLELIKKEKGKQVDFLAWAEKNCYIKKAQAYKLMKVYKNFGDDSDFSKVSMRVLYTLTTLDKDVLKKIIEQARVLAIANNLNTIALETLLNKATDKEATDKEATDKEATDKEATDKEATDKEATDKEATDKEATDKEENKNLQQTSKETDTNMVKELQATIEALNATIDKLQTELREANRPTSIAIMPALPQFNSTCMATVIGLELDNATDKVKINKAYRSLAKLYTSASNAKAARKLKDARDSLIGAIRKDIA